MKQRSPRKLDKFAFLAALSAVACGGGAGQPKKACRDGVASQASALATSSRLFLTASVVTRLQARAAASDPAWVALKKVCDGYTTGSVYPPNGNAYPGSTSVGSGYQGDGYLDAIQTIALCYRTVKGVDEALATKYGTTGAKVLEAMSTPVASGGAKPSTDSGYGIRNYGVGMALGYDWLLPALDATLKTRVVTALNTWVDWYDQSGFTKNDPIANYFVGYLLAKTYTAIATEQDNPKAGAYWSDVENHLWGQLVKPTYSAWMKGGGWPEGWGYGPRAVRGVAEFLWGVKTAKNLDWNAQLPQAREQAAYLRYFAWPSLTRMDDQGTVRSGIDLEPSPSLYTSLATILAELGDPQAPAAASFAADVVAKGADDRAPWQKFLYWDPALKKASYQTDGLSYLAEGPGHVAMRSSWDATASWAALSAGRYTNAQDSGEQMFNAGGVSVVAGGAPVLVNATGWIPSTAGTAGEDFVYTDSWSGGGRRLYNTFFVVDPGSPYSPGQNSASPSKSKAHLELYDDGGGYVRARAHGIEDQYGVSAKPVLTYTRDLVYLRAGTVVLFDKTTVAQPSTDRWMAFHTPSAPTLVATSDATQHRYDVKSGGATTGSLRLLLPKSSQTKTVALPGGTTRIEAHSIGAASQEWLSVVTASGSVPEQTRLSASDGNVTSGAAVGVEIHSAREQIVLFPSLTAMSLSSVSYVVDAGFDADHVLVDVAPSATGYSISTQAGSGGLVVSVKPGGTFKPSAAGVLAFSVTKSGTVGAPTGGGSGGTGGTGGTGGSGGATGGSGGATGGSGGTSGSGGATGGSGGTAAGGAGGTASGGAGSGGAAGSASTGGAAGAANTGGAAGTASAGGAASTGGGGAGGVGSGGAGSEPGTAGSGGTGVGIPACTDPATCAELPPCE
ncbi:MAG: hypothetical protein KJ015_07240 [Myxococcales bacterium]|nr:hypothetical protein [Myxococcales bacterium]